MTALIILFIQKWCSSSLDCAEIIRQQGRNEGVGKAKITRGYNLPAKYINSYGWSTNTWIACFKDESGLVS